MTIEWGAEIEVGGVRPEWLGCSEWSTVQAKNRSGTWLDVEMNGSLSEWAWNYITAIRLPADHFAYVAIAKGFTPWGGGSEAPKDWDGGRILYRDGDNGPPIISWWTHDGGYAGGRPNDKDIIGYHPKPIAQPSPADTVTIARIGEMELSTLPDGKGDPVHGNYSAGYRDAYRDLGLIRPATKAERIAKSTNLPLSDVERVIAAFEETE